MLIIQTKSHITVSQAKLQSVRFQLWIYLMNHISADYLMNHISADYLMNHISADYLMNHISADYCSTPHISKRGLTNNILN